MRKELYAAGTLSVVGIIASIIAYTTIYQPYSSSFYSKLTPDDLEFIKHTALFSKSYETKEEY